jgi:hypothetical protein
MPTPEQLLSGLREIANQWRPLAMIWHAYFGVIAIALLAGARPPKRLCGLVLGLPLLSVSVMAWMSSNPFNGLIFGLLGLMVVYFSLRLPCERVQMSPMMILLPGIILFLFGWVYPHFLNSPSVLAYAFSAPTGLIPCPTLSIVIGLFLILNGLGSRPLSFILAIAGLFYGIFGVFRLGVTIDLVLGLGALTVLMFMKRIPAAAKKV